MGAPYSGKAIVGVLKPECVSLFHVHSPVGCGFFGLFSFYRICGAWIYCPHGVY